MLFIFSPAYSKGQNPHTNRLNPSVQHHLIIFRVTAIAATAFAIFRVVLARCSIRFSLFTASIGALCIGIASVALYRFERGRASKCVEEIAIEELKKNFLCEEHYKNPPLVKKCLEAAKENILPKTKAHWIFGPGGPDTLANLRLIEEFQQIESLVLKSITSKELFEIFEYFLTFIDNPNRPKGKVPNGNLTHFIQRYQQYTRKYRLIAGMSEEQQQRLLQVCNSKEILLDLILNGLPVNTRTEDHQTILMKIVSWLDEGTLTEDIAVKTVSKWFNEFKVDPNLLIDGKSKASAFCKNEALKACLQNLEQKN